MKKVILGLLIMITGQQSFASVEFPKDSTKAPKDSTKCLIWKENHYIDMSLAGGSGVFAPSIQWDKLFGIAWKKRIKIGFGVRVSMANYWETDFHTPFYNRPTVDTFATLRMEHQTTFMANLTFVADISLARWLDVGLSMDLVGVSFGPRSEGVYLDPGSVNNNTRQDSKADLFNAFLFGRNDRGSLNSQFYLRFWLNEDFFIKGNFGILRTSQQTDNSLDYGNQFYMERYMGALSFGWTPGRNAWIKKKKKLHGTITPSF